MNRTLSRVFLLVLAAILAPQLACPPTLPTITFSQQITASIQDNATVKYQFTSPALGNNAAVLGSFRVEDDPSGANGEYQIDVYQGANLVTSAGPAGPGIPTLVSDVDFSTAYPAGTKFEIRVIEVSGTTARTFKVTMSPRYSTPTGISFGSVQSVSLLAGEYESFSIAVSSAQAGAIDFFLRENGSITGSNQVTLLDLDHVTQKSSLTASNDVSLDNSEDPDLALSDSGSSSYLVILRNTDTSASGTYLFFAGPHPTADQPAACEPVTAPGFGTPTPLNGKQLYPEADRDCYEFALPFGIAGLDFTLDETGTTPGSNEVRVSRNGSLVTAKKGATDVSGTAEIDDAAAATYQVVVNNLLDGNPSYSLELGLDGSCLGPTCVVYPMSVTALDFGLENPATRQIRLDAAGNPLPLDAIASFMFDKTSGGTFDLRILGDPGSGVTFLCGTPISGSSDLFVENCSVATVDGLPYAEARRTSGSGTSGTLRMGPDLRPKLVTPTPLALPVPADGNLVTFGDTTIYSFTLAAGAQVGFGFDDQGIGSGNNVVTLCNAADAASCLTNPAFLPIARFTGAGDGGAEAKVLSAGSYVLIADNDGLGAGDFAACAGPGDLASDTEASIHLPANIPPGSPVTDGGGLTCGDSDFRPLTTAVNQPVEINVAESPGVTGTMLARLEEEVPSGSGSWTVRASASGATTAKLPQTTLNLGAPYRIVIDNSSTGIPAYGITIQDPAD